MVLALVILYSIEAVSVAESSASGAVAAASGSAVQQGGSEASDAAVKQGESAASDEQSIAEEQAWVESMQSEDMSGDMSTLAEDSVIAADEVRASLQAQKAAGDAAALKAVKKAERAATYKVDPDKPMVALTFDDGPGKDTKRILKLLKKYKGRATFCVLGNRVEQYSGTIKQMNKQGCQVMGHSWDHKLLTKLSKAKIEKQLSRTADAIEDVTGEKPDMYRPPYGGLNKNVKAVSKELGQSILMWSLDTLDWKYRNANTINGKVMSGVRDGSIILCHDIHSTTADAMEKTIPALVKAGYQLVTVEELMDAKGIKPLPGKRYSQG